MPQKINFSSISKRYHFIIESTNKKHYKMDQPPVFVSELPGLFNWICESMGRPHFEVRTLPSLTNL